MTTPFDTTRPAEEFRRIASELRDDGWHDADDLDVEFLLLHGEPPKWYTGDGRVTFAKACYALVRRPKMVAA